jgi:hypothetical protein
MLHGHTSLVFPILNTASTSPCSMDIVN